MTTSKRRGRPKKTLNVISSMPQIPAGRVFSVNNSNMYNNYLNTISIITLKLMKSDIIELESSIQSNNDFIDKLKSDDSTPNVDVRDKEKSKFSSLFGVMKKSDRLKTQRLQKQEEVEHRKDLIINCGVKRMTTDVLTADGDEWPKISRIACYNCCHTFDSTPVGIPQTLINHKFYCYGNFCSYNCAKRYLCPNYNDQDDLASVFANTDIYVGDSHGEKLQLLELLYHMETGADLTEQIKPAPNKLVLKMFGGSKSIDEFRDSFKTNTNFHTFKMPLVSIGYQIEECQNTGVNGTQKLLNMSLDVHKLQQEYEELLRQNSSL